MPLIVRLLSSLLIEATDSLLCGEDRWVFDLVGEEVVHFFEAEVLAVVVGLGHLPLINY